MNFTNKIRNRTMPETTKMGRLLEKWLGAPFNFLEFIGSYILVRPTQYLLGSLDALSYKLEGTKLHAILQHTIFPFFLTVTLIVGFYFSENEITIASLSALSLVLIIYGVIIAPLERLMPFSRNWNHGDNDFSVDFMMFYSGIIWGVISKFLVKVFLLIHVVEWLAPYGVSIWPAFLPGVVEVFLFILIKDFFRYWYHRWLHEKPFLWRWHAVHHSVERLYWLNGIRSHPMEQVMQTLLWAIPLALLQPPAEIVVVALFTALTIGIFQHANIQLKLRFWEYIFSIGDNHRYHHHNTKEIGDSNYGGEYIVWDILFGTFHNPKNDKPTEEIGIGTAPNYPQTWMGLMIAPFLPNQKVFGKQENPDDPEAS